MENKTFTRFLKLWMGTWNEGIEVDEDLIKTTMENFCKQFSIVIINHAVEIAKFQDKDKLSMKDIENAQKELTTRDVQKEIDLEAATVISAYEIWSKLSSTVDEDLWDYLDDEEMCRVADLVEESLKSVV